MFIAALSTIVKLWKQLKCSSTDKWVKMWCVYVCVYIYTQARACTHTYAHTHTHTHTHAHTEECYSAKKRVKSCNSMDGAGEYYAK